MRSVRNGLRFVLAMAIALGGCNALLDVKDIYLDADAAAPVDLADGNATNPDAAGGDGAADGGVCSGELQTDPRNCGRCGHDCLGGTCTAGRCDAVVLAASLPNPSGLAVAGDNVYFTTYGGTGAVQMVKTSGGSVLTLAPAEIRARGVAVDGNTLYWANGDFIADDAGAYKGGIWKCALPGCSSPALVAPGDYDTSYPTLRNGFLYYGTGQDDTVSRVAVPAGGAPSIVAAGTKPYGIAVDDTHVYFTSLQPFLYRAPVAGGMREIVVAMNGPTSGFVAVDDQRVYWAYVDVNGVGQVSSTPKSPLGGAVTSYGSPQDNVVPIGIAVDAENLYWSTGGSSVGGNEPAGDGKVLTCKKVGCGAAPPTVLATGNVFADQLVVDDVAVYWTEYGAPAGARGRIRKVAKP